ncbi:HAMP domain-containing sensor histidine kinase [Sphingomonas sp. CFBP8993]|uniref:sensor histidine kinase n=1 Tax=Sphingomonas sp. CFBP8993 TaxID=3096526 RepID=UPI002A69930B|nr:HAMP domain-containing sensor histidine kinase [Sphingomonas sp. CFBP8993]MDY0957237.1 HAMP domain-containing sensor histidine kinase [Sphingomonas sp. CFBP8993]
MLGRIWNWRKSMFAQMLVLTSIFLGWGLYAFVIRPLADMPVQVDVPPPLQATESELRSTLAGFMLSVRDDPSDASDIAEDGFLREVAARNPEFRFYVRVGNRAFGNGPPVFFRQFGFAALEQVHRAVADPTICTQGEKIMDGKDGDGYASFRMCDKLTYFEYHDLRHPVVIEHSSPLGVRRKWISAFSGNFLLAAGGVFLIFAIIFSLHMWSIRRVARLARSIDPQRLDALLPEKGVASEILPLVRAVNHLIAQVDAAQRRATFFLSAAAHEMRTPLTVLRTRLELMEDGPQKDKLIGDVRRLTRLVNQLLTLMSIGNRRDVTGFTDLTASAAKVIRGRMPLAEQADVTLMLDSARDEVEIPGDATLIESAIANLVDNAISFAPPGTTVRVAIDADGRITVRDHGPGFGDIDPVALFEPFARPVSARRGYGLGLAIVAAIVRLHGGDMCARNAEDGGAEFTLTFAS